MNIINKGMSACIELLPPLENVDYINTLKRNLKKNLLGKRIKKYGKNIKSKQCLECVRLPL